MATGSRHFQRQPKGRMVVTDRDVSLLQRIAQRRFLSSSHLMVLEGNGRHPNVLRKRLRVLYDHKYVNRYRDPAEDGLTGSRPRVYGLASRGAAELLKHTTVRFPSEGTTRAFMEHALQVSDAMVAFEESCRRHGVRLVPFEEIMGQASPAARKRGAQNPALAHGWPVKFRHGNRDRTLNVYPDAIFGIKAAGEEPSYFFLEADRGTEPVVRRNLRLSSFYKKFLLYYHSWVQWRPREDPKLPHTRSEPPYGFRNPRVLTVVATKKDPEARINNLLAGAQEFAPYASGLFLFTTHEALVADDALTHEWRNAKGKPVRLVGKN